MSIPESLSARLAVLKASQQEKRSSKELLALVIKMYLLFPEKLSENYFRCLKEMLYVWCLCYPSWQFNELTQKKFRKRFSLKLTYEQYKEVDELAYQITRFLNYGEFYWYNTKFQWDTQPRVLQDVILDIIFEELDKL